jgi:DNA-binding NarL/FixJ family response regulator
MSRTLDPNTVRIAHGGLPRSRGHPHATVNGAGPSPAPQAVPRDEQERAGSDPAEAGGAPWARLLERIDWVRAGNVLGLSARELDVVRLILSGYKQSAIGSALGLALGTVKTYQRRVYRKIQVGNRCELTLAILSVALGDGQSTDG